MSLRTRLILFFVGIVIIPMVVVAVVLFGLVRSSDEARTSARVDQARSAAIGLYRDFQARAQIAGRIIGRDGRLSEAIRAGDAEAARERLAALAERTQTRRARLALPDQPPVTVGAEEAIAPARTTLVDGAGEVAELTTSVVRVEEYVRLLERVTGLEAGVWGSDGVLAATLDQVASEPPPAEGTADVNSDEYRVTGFSAPAFDGGQMEIRALSPVGTTPAGATRAAIFVGAALLGFFVLAVAFAVAVWRSLRREYRRLLLAAQQIGKGDFSVELATEGRDEFAALAGEFNDMARELEARVDELQRERARLQEAIRRVGESFAAGLDRDALLEIVVQTAVDGVGAMCGRATLRDQPGAPDGAVAVTGPVAEYQAAMQAAEAALADTGEAAEVRMNGASALAQALHATDGDRRVLGVMSVARSGRPFSEPERELFSYLSNQAAVSIENVDLHETVQRQAMTDDLTGLFNHRRFQEVMSLEVERARRFDQPMSLIMMDIDDFKLVNDVHGHLQGDLVLREVARVLRESSREIDEPARYGGEEMAVALPQTDLEGAFRFAERVRQRIERLELPLVDGDGTLNVTASFGAATLNGVEAVDKDGLVAAADAALYEAKRAGKNRTVKAGVA